MIEPQKKNEKAGWTLMLIFSWLRKQKIYQ